MEKEAMSKKEYKNPGGIRKRMDENSRPRNWNISRMRSSWVMNIPISPQMERCCQRNGQGGFWKRGLTV